MVARGRGPFFIVNIENLVRETDLANVALLFEERFFLFWVVFFLYFGGSSHTFSYNMCGIVHYI